MVKEVIFEKELLNKIEFILEGEPVACRNLRITSLDRNPIDDVANWDVGGGFGLQKSGEDNDWTGCKEKIRSEMEQLRVNYDVA